MTTVAPSTIDTRPDAPVGFGAALGSEWAKLSSMRSFRLTLVLGTVLGIGVAALLAWVVLLTWRDWPAEDVAAFDVTESAMIGTLLTTVLFAVLGVTAVTSEYASRMIMLTLTATPRRGRVLAAKLIVVSAATLVASLVATTGMVVTVRLMLANLDFPASSDAVRTVLGVSALAWVLPFLAVCLATVLRSAAGTVAAILGFIFLPGILGPLLPSWWSRVGQRYLLGNAADSLSLSHLPQPGYLSVPVAALVLAIWLAAFATLAYVALQRRDA